MFDRLLVATDGSDLSDKAVQAALNLAWKNGATVVALGVVEPYPYSPMADPEFLPDYAKWERESNDWAQKSVDRVVNLARDAGIVCESKVVVGSPATEIVRAARECRCDTIFMASHGRHGLDRLLLGSVTQKVLLTSTLPVVVFR